MAESYLGGHSVTGSNSNAMPRNQAPLRLSEHGPAREQAKERERAARAKRIKADQERVAATAKIIRQLSASGRPIGFDTVEKAMKRAEAANVSPGRSMAAALAAAIGQAHPKSGK